MISRSRSSTQSQRRGPTARSSSSSPYPFHPDRLDPASPPNSAESYDNSVNWYYSSYNQDTSSSQRRDPGPGPRRQRTSAAASLGSVWSSVVTPALLLILLSYRQ